jgi:hypothetical protein
VPLRGSCAKIPFKIGRARGNAAMLSECFQTRTRSCHNVAYHDDHGVYTFDDNKFYARVRVHLIASTKRILSTLYGAVADILGLAREYERANQRALGNNHPGRLKGPSRASDRPLLAWWGFPFERTQIHTILT